MTLDFRLLGLGTEHLDYRPTWDLQRELHAEVAAGRTPNTVLLLEHSSVYTAGKRTEAHERPLDGTPVVDVDRGGKITWHGPGQLVAYPIVKLPQAVYVVDYVRRLEEAMIGLFADYGLATGRVKGRSGVWLPADRGPGTGQPRIERKIAAIGVRVAGGTTMHGVAINVDPDLTRFDTIIPCGLADAGVTSLALELGHAPSLVDVAAVFRPHLQRLLSFEPYEQSGYLVSETDPVAGQGTATAPVTYGLTVGV